MKNMIHHDGKKIQETYDLLYTLSMNAERRLLLLVSVLSESLLSLVSSDLMLFSFLTARHSSAPYSNWIFL